jgi:hypothetical protein
MCVGHCISIAQAEEKSRTVVRSNSTSKPHYLLQKPDTQTVTVQVKQADQTAAAPFSAGLQQSQLQTQMAA